MLIVGGDRVEFREGEEVVMGFITFPPPQLPLSVASPAVNPPGHLYLLHPPTLLHPTL